MGKKEKIGLGIIVIIIGLMVVFFGMRKVNYHIDEVWNYGLANNVGGIVPNIDYGRVYQGMGPFESFMEVSEGERFNYVNVWQNQADDVHPPLSYLFLHTVSSLAPGTYSKWYGIGINMIWMTLILVILYKLSKNILKDKLGAFGVVVAYGTTVLFFDTIIFIRMYAQFTFFAILLAWLIKQYWDKTLTRKFFISIFSILVLGVLTHYYFLIYAFFVCVLFLVNLILQKRYVELKKSIICFASAGIFYIAIWYHILGHIFRGYRGKDAIGKAFSFGGLFNGIFSMARIVDKSVFCGAMILFIVLGIIGVVLKCKKKEKLFGYNFALFIAGALYLVMVGKIAPYMDERYIMNIGFIFVLEAFVVANKVLRLKLDRVKAQIIICLLFLIINVVNVASRDFYIPRDGYSEAYCNTMDLVKDKTVVEYVQQDWEMIGFLEPLKNAKSYVFVNDDNIDEVIKEQTDDYILLTYAEEGNEIVADLDGELVQTLGSGNYYLISR